MDSQQVQALRLAAMQARAEGRRYVVVERSAWDYRAIAADELDGTEAAVATVGPDGWVDWSAQESLGV